MNFEIFFKLKKLLTFLLPVRVEGQWNGKKVNGLEVVMQRSPGGGADRRKQRSDMAKKASSSQMLKPMDIRGKWVTEGTYCV